MPITIGQNIFSLKAQRKLAEGSSTLSTVYERLSSGQRINHASDDAAGLAVATALKSDVRVYTQGIRNINDGISLLSIAESAVESLGTVLERLREITTEALNGTYSQTQRRALDGEAKALASEYNRIVETTEFNNRALIDGSSVQFSIQQGYGNQEQTTFQLGKDLSRTLAERSFSQTPQFLGADLGSTTAVVRAADFNGDGLSDLLLAATVGTTSTQILFSNGDGTFLQKNISPTRSGYALEFTGDSFSDLFGTNGSTLYTL